MPDSDSWWVLAAVAIGAAVIGGTVVALIMNHRSQQVAPQAVFSLSPAAPIMTNKEEITWQDWRGRDRRMTIHREVH